MSVNHVKSNPVIYGLTGGIASGKSTALSYLRKKGIKIFDSDYAVSEIWKKESLQMKVKKTYNIDISNKAGKKELGNLIFSNEKIKLEIESLIHPLVFKQIDKWLKKQKDEKLVIIDMPLLFEVGYNKFVDKTILIDIEEKNQLIRLMKRNNLSKKDALLRIHSQMNMEGKRKLSNIIIDNNGSIEDLYLKLDILIKELLDEN